MEILNALSFESIKAYLTLYHFIFWSLGLLHLRAGLAYVIHPHKKDTYISSGYSVGMTKDMGAHLWWLGCLLIALGFVTNFRIQFASILLLIIGLIVPIIAEFQNIKNGLQSSKAYPRIVLKIGYIVLGTIYLLSNFSRFSL